MNWQRVLALTGLAATLVISAEIAARVDDWIQLGVPLGHTPDDLIDLRVTDSLGVHGRPYGQYHGFRLNNYGFRGPDMTPLPAPGCTRILVLGASETMGYFERQGKEYPAQLRDSLRSRGCYEVVNAGIPGSTVKALILHWQRYASRFGARIVLVYPTPVFYLGIDPPKWPSTDGPFIERSAPWRPRLLDRIHNVIHTPDFIQQWREQRWIADDIRGKPMSWFFQSTPEDRLGAYVSDLDSLVKSIRASGAKPVLMTHAMRFTIPAQPADDFLLLAWRRGNERATSAMMLDFERTAAERTRLYAKSAQVPVVDIDSALTGKGFLFEDVMHFTEEGSSLVAGLIAGALVHDGLVGQSAGGGLTRRSKSDSDHR